MKILHIMQIWVLKHISGVFGCICNTLTLVRSLLQVDRLMELHFKYLEAVQLADKRIEGEKHVRFTHTHVHA